MKTKAPYGNVTKIVKLGKQEVIINGFAIFVVKKSNELILELKLTY